jgi:HK97 family phage prohead protease/HK97 family phage major capsid protein
METNRAYSILEIKAIDDDKRIIEGIATTPSPDRYQDIVEPKGMEFTLPLPLLNQHRSSEPIGQVIDAKVSKNGIRIKAQIAAAGVLQYVDTVWAQLKAGLVRGLSIGFRDIEAAYMSDTGGIHFIRTEWLELSVVTIAANSDCTITAIKSADRLRAASGTGSTVVRLGATANPPGVSGTTLGTTMTIKEQITQFENKRAANIARMKTLMDAAGEKGETLNEADGQEHDNLEAEVKTIDVHLTRLRASEQALIATATTVTPGNTASPQAAAATRGGAPVIVSVHDQTPKGIGFARACLAMLACRGNRTEACEAVRKHYPDMATELEMIIKAEQLPGTTTGTTWAAPLIQSSSRLVGEFIEMLRAATIIGRVPLRRVPFNVTVPVQTGGGTYQWVGENQPKPVSGLALGTTVLRWAKISGIVPFTKEAMRFSDPSIEQMVRNDMVAGCAAYMDTQFVDPAVHESVNVSPASITDQIVNTAASGTTAAAFRADFRNILGKMITNNQDPTTLRILMSASVAMNLASLINATSTLPEFPTINMQGGTYLGIPITVSQAVGARVILFNPNHILIAQDDNLTIDVSEEASVVMTTTPASSPAATSLVSFWQNNLIGLRLDQFVFWKRAQTLDVEYISNAVYSG